jgi:hypothetical protein
VIDLYENEAATNVRHVCFRIKNPAVGSRDFDPSLMSGYLENEAGGYWEPISGRYNLTQFSVGETSIDLEMNFSLEMNSPITSPQSVQITGDVVHRRVE